MITSERISEIDRRAEVWRQGDFVITDGLPFIYLADLAAPLTPTAQQIASEGHSEGLQVIDVETHGFVVVTQTCDLVRSSSDREYVEVCPLVIVPEEEMHLVRSGRRTRLLAVPALDSMLMAADLDRIMTIEKAVLIRFDEQRSSGVTSEAQARVFREALGKKRSRAALPDDFTRAVRKLRNRILEKHERHTDEGNFLRSVREIRMLAKHNWTDAEVGVEFLFIFEVSAQISDAYGEIVEGLMTHFKIDDHFVEVTGRLVGLDTLSAATYLQSDLLELDHLSQSSEE